MMFFGQRNLTLLWVVAASAFLSIPDISHAQQEISQSVNALQELVVTAQKRTENLQDVPVAVTVLEAGSLASKGASGVLDLNSVVPGLYFTTNGGEGQPRIRGIGAANTSAGNEGSVSTYVDDVYYAASAASVFSFNNIQQISVLKGPQGTLFGRNATGGLIQVTTRDPTQEVNGNLDVTYGSQETTGIDAYLSGGVLPGLAADLAVYYNNMGEGFGRDMYDGADVNRSNDLALRSKWIYVPDDAIKLTLIADYSRSRDSFPAFRPAYGETELGGYKYTGGPFDVDADSDQQSILRQYGFSLNAQVTFDGLKAISITAYRNNSFNAAFDLDATPVPLLAVSFEEPGQQYSEELQLQSDNPGRLSWVGGLYFFRYTSGFVPAVVDGLAIGLAPGVQGEQILTTHQTTNSYAVFGQAIYKIDDLTNFTLGLRDTDEQKSITSPGGSFDGFPLASYSARNRVNKPTWRIALDHHFEPNLMGYISYDRGFKNGGYDPSQATPKPFSPESLDAYEVGVKSEAFNKKLRLNAAAYYYNYRGIQLNEYLDSGLINIYNGSSATVKGLDLDVTAIPLSGLTLTGGLSYVDGRYGNFPVSVTAPAPGGGLEQLAPESASGKHLQNAPDWQGNFGANYTFTVSAETLTLDASYAYTGRWYEAPENRFSQAPYSLVNAGATWIFGTGERYHVKLWGKNLGKTVYAEQLAVELPLGDTIAVAPGRTFGLTAGVTF